MACELVTLSDDRVKRFGDSRLYLICGKVISLWTDGIDMSDPKDLAGMVEFAERLFEPESKIRRAYGDETICDLCDDPTGGLIVGLYPVSMLKDPEIKKMIMKELGLDGEAV